MTMFCKDLKEHGMEIINYEKKKIIPLTDKEKETHENKKVCYICEKEFSKYNKSKYYKNLKKVRDHCHYMGQDRGAAHSICNLRYQIPNEILIVFHNGSGYDYHFIIRQLAKEFEGNFEFIGENTEKYISLSLTINKEHGNGKTIMYKLKFIDSYRFMQNSLLSLVDNL